MNFQQVLPPQDDPEESSHGALVIETSPEGISIEDAIERVGMGPFQRRVIWACGFCFASNSIEVLLLSFLSIVLRADWDLTYSETASITSSSFLGALVGTLLMGRLADAIGRRPVFLLTTVTVASFGVATAAAPSYRMLLLFRFLVGIGLGGLTVPYDSMAELATKRNRGRSLIWLGYFGTLGTLLVPLFAYMSLGRYTSGSIAGLEPWQLFVVLGTIPSWISLLGGLLFVPESPRWLLIKGNHSKALKILRKAASVNGLDPDRFLPLDLKLRLEAKDTGRIRQLFSQKWRRLSLVLLGTWFGAGLLHSATVLVVTLVFANTAVVDAVNATILDESASTNDYDFDYAVIFSSCSSEAVGNLILLVTIMRFGRIVMQCVSYTLGGIAIWLLCIGVAVGKSSVPVLGLWAFLARMLVVCGLHLTWITTAEVLPTEIRTTGHGLAHAASRLGGAVSPFLASPDTLLQLIGIVLFLVSAITTWLASQLPETKGYVMGIGKGWQPHDENVPFVEIKNKRDGVIKRNSKGDIEE